MMVLVSACSVYMHRQNTGQNCTDIQHLSNNGKALNIMKLSFSLRGKPIPQATERHHLGGLDINPSINLLFEMSLHLVVIFRDVVKPFSLFLNLPGSETL